MKRFVPIFLISFLTSIPLIQAETAFKMDGRSFSTEDLAKESREPFYDLDKKKFELIKQIAGSRYIDSFFDKIAQSKKISRDKAREDYLAEKANPTAEEIKWALQEFATQPSLKDMTAEERKKAIVTYMKQSKSRDLLTQIVNDAIASKKLEIVFPEPMQPQYDIAIVKGDFVRYGPDPKDTSPSCQGDSCPITIVEYSEFQCPFCAKTMPAVQQVLKEYKGKIRWITRDYPIPGHPRARPAAIAAHCAGEQKKYWQMYTTLFDNQGKLDDKDLKAHAQAIGVDMKEYEDCTKNPERVTAQINGNIESAEKYGVSGTPTFFINGLRVSGSLPFGEFKRLITESLQKKKAPSH